MNRADWMNLIKSGAWPALEDKWLEAVADAGAVASDLLAVIEAVAKAGQAERAATLAWMWVTAARERGEPRDLLEWAGEAMVASGGNDALRTDVAGLYELAYADHPGIEKLIEVSGLAGGKTPRRALRTLDMCIPLKAGSYLLSRAEEKPAEVVETRWDTATFVVRSGDGSEVLDADQLAATYHTADPHDFRVLTALHPERFAEALDDDPAGVIVSLLQSRGGRMDADEVKRTLVPRHMEDAAWSKWWSRARTALKRHPNVRLEGRTPITLTYDPVGQSLEDEVRERWGHLRSPEDRVALIDSYLREARSRKSAVDAALLGEWATAMTRQMERHHDHPAQAVRCAVVIERLRRSGHVPSDGPSPVEQIFRQAADPAPVLQEFSASELMALVLDPLAAACPDRWTDVVLALLPSCAPNVCDLLADRVLAAGRRDALVAAVKQLPQQLPASLRAVAWLWRGPRTAEPVDPPPRIELLGRMLGVLADLARDETTSPDALKDARAIVRTALTAGNLGVFRDAMASIEPEMASAVYRQVTRTPGLSGALVHDLAKIVREMFPKLFETRRLDPWEDPNVIYTSEYGRSKANEELAYIRNVKMPENARAIGEAASHGDLSENSEYKFALEERDLLRARAGKLQEEVSQARLIQPDDIPVDRVGVGSRVTLRRVDTGEVRELTFLGPWDADIDRNILNYRAPVSQRMMGLRVGDTVMLALDGAEHEYRIDAITRGL